VSDQNSGGQGLQKNFLLASQRELFFLKQKNFRKPAGLGLDRRGVGESKLASGLRAFGEAPKAPRFSLFPLKIFKRKKTKNIFLTAEFIVTIVTG
jgi:hypothetical protein